MNYCQHCGTPLSSDTGFCSHCGREIASTQLQQTQQQNNSLMYGGHQLFPDGFQPTTQQPTTAIKETPYQFAPTAPTQASFDEASLAPHTFATETMPPLTNVSYPDAPTVDAILQPRHTNKKQRFSRSLRNVMIAVLAGIVVVALSGGAYALLSHNANNSENSPVETSSGAPASEVPAEVNDTPHTNNLSESTNNLQETSGENPCTADVSERNNPSDIEGRMQSKTGYLLPESNTKEIAEADVEHFSDYQLYLARNEIYARHGRKFSKKDLQDYFSEKQWYIPTYSPAEFESQMNGLTDIERKNAEELRRIEEERGSVYLI